MIRVIWVTAGAIIGHLWPEVRRDHRRYDWSWCKALRVACWWNVEHSGVYRGDDGGLWGYVRRYGRARRWAAERS